MEVGPSDPCTDHFVTHWVHCQAGEIWTYILAMAPTSGFLMGGRPPSETLKGDLVPGGHAEHLCVFSDCGLCLASQRASTAPLLTLGVGHLGCPVETHSG